VLSFLNSFEKKLNKNNPAAPLTLTWKDFYYDGDHIDEEHILANTFLNTNVSQKTAKLFDMEGYADPFSLHSRSQLGGTTGGSRGAINTLRMFHRHIGELGAEQVITQGGVGVAGQGSKKKLLRFKVSWRDEVTKKHVRMHNGNMMLQKIPLEEVIPENYNKYQRKSMFAIKQALSQEKKETGLTIADKEKLNKKQIALM